MSATRDKFKTIIIRTQDQPAATAGSSFRPLKMDWREFTPIILFHFPPDMSDLTKGPFQTVEFPNWPWALTDPWSPATGLAHVSKSIAPSHVGLLSLALSHTYMEHTMEKIFHKETG